MWLSKCQPTIDLRFLIYHLYRNGSWAQVTSRLCLHGVLYTFLTQKSVKQTVKRMPKTVKRMSSVNRDTPGGVVSSKCQPVSRICQMKRLAALLYHIFCNLSSVFCENFFIYFFKKVLQLFFRCAIIIL